MTTKLSVYSADQVKIVICGLVFESGFADGEFLTIEMASDDYSDKVGPDGDVERARTNDARADIKLKLLQTSQGNTYLVALREADMASPNGGGIGSFLVTDLCAGAIIAKAEKVWIKKPPSTGRGKEGVETEWALRASHMKLTPVGSPAV